MRFVSYSQEFEDLILYVLLKDYVSKGTYIDVGANDPIVDSVTKSFYDMGWSGINIEPLDNLCELLHAERPRDINLCVGAGAKRDVMQLAVAHGRSSFDRTEDERIKKDLALEELHYLTKEIIPLAEICDRYLDNKREVHFCKIDVEGLEKEVLLGLDFTKVRPWIFVMESTEPGTMNPTYEQWESILLENNYEFGLQHGVNRYYIAREKSFLQQRLTSISKYISENDVYKNFIHPVA